MPAASREWLHALDEAKSLHTQCHALPDSKTTRKRSIKYSLRTIMPPRPEFSTIVSSYTRQACRKACAKLCWCVCTRPHRLPGHLLPFGAESDRAELVPAAGIEPATNGLQGDLYHGCTSPHTCPRQRLRVTNGVSSSRLIERQYSRQRIVTSLTFLAPSVIVCRAIRHDVSPVQHSQGSNHAQK